MKEVRDSLDDVRHEVNNHESEIRMFENRLHNQEMIMDTIRSQLTESIESRQDLVKGQLSDLEYKTNGIDETLKSLTSDMRQTRSQSNEFITVLGQYKQKLIEFEKLADAQNGYMKNLESALNSVMEALQARDVAEKGFKVNGDPVREYKVRQGDNLEKIARLHKVSVQSIRDLNGLGQDRIMIGQPLKIPR